MPPYPPLYTESEWPLVQARYEQLERDWQRENSITMTLDLILGLLGPMAVIGLVLILAIEMFPK